MSFLRRRTPHQPATETTTFEITDEVLDPDADFDATGNFPPRQRHRRDANRAGAGPRRRSDAESTPAADRLGAVAGDESVDDSPLSAGRGAGAPESDPPAGEPYRAVGLASRRHVIFAVVLSFLVGGWALLAVFAGRAPLANEPITSRPEAPQRELATRSQREGKT